MKRKHDVIVEHDWGDPHEHPYDGNGTLKVQICRVCGTEQSTLVLDRSKDDRPAMDMLKSTDPAVQRRVAQQFSELGDQLKKVVDRMDEYQSAICDGTKYSNCMEFAEALERSHQGVVTPADITFGAMEHMIATNDGPSGRKHRRKVLLAFRQGLVCDVCDNVAFSLGDLTEDHIVPRALGGQSTLINLRLVCRCCNQNKADRAPGKFDVSPFAWTGKQCVHRVKCAELQEMRTPFARTSRPSRRIWMRRLARLPRFFRRRDK